jgi:hypothetical protein
MSSNIEKSSSVNTKIQQKSSSNKVFLLIIVLIVAGIYFITNNYHSILAYIYNQEKTTTYLSENKEKPELPDQNIESDSGITSELIPSQEVEANHSFDDSKTSVDASISFAPTIEEPKECLVPLDQSTKREEDQINNITSQRELEPKILTAKLREYRNFLANANELIIGFLSEEDYSLQLKNFESSRVLKMPNEIKEILQLMREHLHLMNNPTHPLQIFPLEWKAVENFVKITKSSEDSKQQSWIKNKIIQKLKIFIAYLYSEDLQEQFLQNHSARIGN